MSFDIIPDSNVFLQSVLIASRNVCFRWSHGLSRSASYRPWVT